MRRRSTTLTEQELEIMKIVWERDRSTVRDVYETLLERRKVAYTTVMTMMKILEQKKYLKKTMADRAYVYQPARLLAHPPGRLPAPARRPPVGASSPHPHRRRPLGHHRARASTAGAGAHRAPRRSRAASA